MTSGAKIIVAVARSDGGAPLDARVVSGGVIGVGGKIPWHHPGDLARFKRVTMGATVIMGRLTWESIGRRALPGRTNIVVTSQRAYPTAASMRTYPSVGDAIEASRAPIWILGGARIYEEALSLVDAIDATLVPDVIDAEDAVRFPTFDLRAWDVGDVVPHEDEPRLARCIFSRPGRP